jgi:hypothetical protein
MDHFESPSQTGRLLSAAATEIPAEAGNPDVILSDGSLQAYGGQDTKVFRRCVLSGAEGQDTAAGAAHALSQLRTQRLDAAAEVHRRRAECAGQDHVHRRQDDLAVRQERHTAFAARAANPTLGSISMLHSDGTPAPGSPFHSGGSWGSWAVVIDGNDNVWSSNFAGASITELCGARTGPAHRA